MDKPVSCSLSLGRSHYVAMANTGKEVFSPSNFITIGGEDVTFVPMTEIYHYRSPQEGWNLHFCQIFHMVFLDKDFMKIKEPVGFNVYAVGRNSFIIFRSIIIMNHLCK